MVCMHGNYSSATPICAVDSTSIGGVIVLATFKDLIILATALRRMALILKHAKDTYTVYTTISSFFCTICNLHYRALKAATTLWPTHSSNTLEHHTAYSAVSSAPLIVSCWGPLLRLS